MYNLLHCPCKIRFLDVIPHQSIYFCLIILNGCMVVHHLGGGAATLEISTDFLRSQVKLEDNMDNHSKYTFGLKPSC